MNKINHMKTSLKLGIIGVAAAGAMLLTPSAHANNNVFYWIGVQYGNASSADAKAAVKAGRNIFKTWRKTPSLANAANLSNSIEAALTGTSNTTLNTNYQNSGLIAKTTPDRILQFANRWIPDYAPLSARLTADTIFSDTGIGTFTAWKYGSDVEKGRTRAALNAARRALQQPLRLKQPKSLIIPTSAFDGVLDANVAGAANTIAYNFFVGALNGVNATTNQVFQQSRVALIANTMTRVAAAGKTGKSPSLPVGGLATALSATFVAHPLLGGNVTYNSVIDGIVKAMTPRAKKYAIQIAGGVYYGMLGVATQIGDSAFLTTGKDAAFGQILGAVEALLKGKLLAAFQAEIVSTLFNLDDAIFSVANFLFQNGFRKEDANTYFKALFAYNKSSAYVSEILEAYKKLSSGGY